MIITLKSTISYESGIKAGLMPVMAALKYLTKDL